MKEPGTIEKTLPREACDVLGPDYFYGHKESWTLLDCRTFIRKRVRIDFLCLSFRYSKEVATVREGKIWTSDTRIAHILADDGINVMLV